MEFCSNLVHRPGFPYISIRFPFLNFEVHMSDEFTCPMLGSLDGSQQASDARPLPCQGLQWSLKMSWKLRNSWATIVTHEECQDWNLKGDSWNSLSLPMLTQVSDTFSCNVMSCVHVVCSCCTFLVLQPWSGLQNQFESGQGGCGNGIIREYTVYIAYLLLSIVVVR